MTRKKRLRLEIMLRVKDLDQDRERLDCIKTLDIKGGQLKKSMGNAGSPQREFSQQKRELWVNV